MIAEAHSEQAARLVETRRLYAPAHWLAEAINGLWGQVFGGQLEADDVARRVALLLSAPVTNIPPAGLAEHALSLSIAYGITACDSLYVALALGRGIPLVTADRKLVRKLAQAGMKPNVCRWIGEFYQAD